MNGRRIENIGGAGCFREQGPGSGANLLERDRQDTARLRKGIAAIAAARITGKIVLHDAILCLPGAPVHGAARTEDCDDGTAEGRSDMRGAAVIANENAAARDQRDQLAQVERIEKNEFRGALAADFGGDFGFAASEIENRLDSMLVAQVSREGNKFVDGPTLGEIFRAGMQHGVRFTLWNATRGELLCHVSLSVELWIHSRGRNRSARESGGVKLLHAMLDGMYAVAGIGNEHVINERELAMGPADALRHSDECD